jgi:hypothetical protein
MTKQLSLDISDNNYDELTSLSKLFNQGIEKTVTDILEVLGFEHRNLESLTKEYKLPFLTSRMVFSHFFDAARNSVGLFNDLLERLGAKGLYLLEDFDYDLEECEFTFSYSALVGNKLSVDSIWVTVEPGLKSLRAESIIDMEKIRQESIEKLKQIAKDFEEPSEFMDLENFDVNVEDEIEGIASLVIECQAETLEDIPNINVISRVLRKLLKNAGITRKLNLG